MKTSEYRHLEGKGLKLLKKNVIHVFIRIPSLMLGENLSITPSLILCQQLNFFYEFNHFNLFIRVR